MLLLPVLFLIGQSRYLLHNLICAAYLSFRPDKQAISHVTRLQIPELTPELLAMRAGRSFGRGRRRRLCFFLLGLWLVGRVGSLSEFRISACVPMLCLGGFQYVCCSSGRVLSRKNLLRMGYPDMRFVTLL